MAQVNQEIAVKFTDILIIVVPILGGINAWLWKLISKNNNLTVDNATEIKLLKQTVFNHQGQVDTTEHKVNNLSDEMTEMKFSIQALDNKADKNHIEIMSALKDKTNNI